MDSALSLLAIILSCWLLLEAVGPEGLAEGILIFFCLCAAQIVASGYILSSLNLLSYVWCWSALNILTAAVIYFIVLNRVTVRRGGFLNFFQPDLRRNINATWNFYKSGFEELPRFEKLILCMLMSTVIVGGVINLAIVVLTAPHNWDSMTYHLARVAYYIQHQNTTYYYTNYYPQVMWPKNSSLLHLYSYLSSGRNENLTQLVQYLSYWIALCSVYAISRKIGNNRAHSVFASAICALLIDWLMEATTTQNDLIMTAYLGSAVYFLFAFRSKQQFKYLFLSALPIGLAIGTKANALLMLPSVILLALYLLIDFRSNLRQQLRNLLIWGLCLLVTSSIFVLPAGYIENVRNFGHPIGTIEVRTEHSFEGRPLGYVIKHGTKNLIRYGFEFLSLDGIPKIEVVKKAQSLIRFVPEKIAGALDLGDTEATRSNFDIGKEPIAHEDFSYWGILGFALIWPLVLLSAVGVVGSKDHRVLAIASIVFFLSQAYAGPYDPWRGRAFMAAAIFAAPISGAWLRAQNSFLRAYLFIIAIAGCISAISGLVLRNRSPIISVSYGKINLPSVFAMDRLKRLTSNRSIYYEPTKKFDELVPKDAVVALFTGGDVFEYPLFGEGLTRTIIPINVFDKGPQVIPSNAQYLLYDKAFPCGAGEDLPLGEDWYLRYLTENNRGCP